MIDGRNWIEINAKISVANRYFIFGWFCILFFILLKKIKIMDRMKLIENLKIELQNYNDYM